MPGATSSIRIAPTANAIQDELASVFAGNGRGGLRRRSVFRRDDSHYFLALSMSCRDRRSPFVQEKDKTARCWILPEKFWENGNFRSGVLRYTVKTCRR